MKTCSSLITIACLASVQVLAAEPVRTIEAKAGKTVCHRESRTVGADTAESRLCITQRNFQNDVYVFAFNNQALFKAIDDQTTHGVAGTYKATRFSMTCTPQLSVPEATPEQVKLGHTQLPTETGRLCEIRANDAPFYAVQVNFE